MIIKSTRNNTTLFVKGFLFNLDDSGAWYHHGRRYSFDLLETDDGVRAVAWNDDGFVHEQYGESYEEALDGLLIVLRLRN